MVQRLAIVLAIALTASIAEAQAPRPFTCIKTFGQREWNALVNNLDAETKKRFLENESVREVQADNLEQLFVIACEAVKRGAHKDKTNAAELEYIRLEATAVEYDKKSSPAGPAFSKITAAQVAQFYKNALNEKAFEDFLTAKLAVLRAGGATDTENVTAEQREQARDLYAKLKISERQSIVTGVGLREPFRSETDLKIRIMQSQFLVRTAIDWINSETSATDAEIAEYISKHPELSPAAKQARAASILQRAKSGEDFAKLANEFSEDPGNGSGSDKHGGLYADVPVGQMIPAFEKAALSLEAGQVHATLVETDYGYHIVKLEKKTSGADGVKYDVRHILISTGIKDPNNPTGREVPLGTWARKQVEDGKEGAMFANLRRSHQVAVAKYAVPAVAPKTAPAAAPAKRVVRKRRG